MNKVQEWIDVYDSFDDADLLLGNGFSINIDPNFSYDSLFRSFLIMVEDRFEKIVRQFNTNNFEFIVEELNSAERVNKIFGVEAPEIKATIDLLQKGLIRAIENNHPRKEQIKWGYIDKISDQILTQFEDIFTLNYDIYLYHIILNINEKIEEDDIYQGQKRYADGFWKKIDLRYKEFPGFQDYDYRMVYYLHGALFIFKKYYSDQKLIRGTHDQEIIDLIAKAISNGNFPLFISEGNSSDKKSMISRSTYLNYCFKQLRDSKRDLVIFGASLGSQDEHIVRQINLSPKRPKRIGYAIYLKGKKNGEIKREMNRMRANFNNHELVFFDSSTLFQS